MWNKKGYTTKEGCKCGTIFTNETGRFYTRNTLSDTQMYKQMDTDLRFHNCYTTVSRLTGHINRRLTACARPQAKFFYIYGWLIKIYGCFSAKPENCGEGIFRLIIPAVYQIYG